MGCLFGKKTKTEHTESEISQEVSIKIEPIPFNTVNESKFLGYPQYTILTKQLNEILQKPVSEWSQYEQTLGKEKLKAQQYSQLMDALLNDEEVNNFVISLISTIQQIPKEFNINFRKCLIIDIQTACFQWPAKNIFYYVTISIGNKETEQQTTAVQKAQKQMEWNEIFMYSLDDVDLKNSFKIQIMQQSSLGGSQPSPVGHSVTFNFEELIEQIVHEKAIKLKEKDDIIGILQMKCQLVYNIKDFALYWRRELIYRIQQIERIIQRSRLSPNGSESQFESLMSFHSNRQANETVYDLQYVVS